MATQRTIIAGTLTWGSVVALLWAAVLIAWTLTSSWLSDDWPFKYWGNWTSNHGPWRYDFGLIPNPRRERLSDAFVLLLEAVKVSACAVLISWKWLSVTVFVVNTLALWLTVHYLLWLID